MCDETKVNLGCCPSVVLRELIVYDLWLPPRPRPQKQTNKQKDRGGGGGAGGRGRKKEIGGSEQERERDEGRKENLYMAH